MSHLSRGKCRADFTRATILLVGMTVSPAFGQFDHSDVSFRYQDGVIVTTKDVYEARFPTSGISRQFTSNPGFASETDADGGTGANDELVYHVLDRLWLWSDDSFVMPPSNTRIRIQNNPPAIPATLVSSQTGYQEGLFDPPINRIGRSSASGDFHSHVNFFLETVEDKDPVFGAYGLKLSLSSSNDQIVDSAAFFIIHNFGLDQALLDNAIDAYARLLMAIPGDFNGNGQLDAEDIHQLTQATLDSGLTPEFDLNADGQLDFEDRRVWVEELARTYFGDANLDGVFTSSDLVQVFQQGAYEDNVTTNSRWEDGDWNGDREFDSSDFVLAFQAGGYETGPRASHVVPEPGARALVCVAMLSLVCFRNR